MAERRKLARRDFSYYMRVMNERTGEVIGHLADISTGGFKLETTCPVAKNLEVVMRMELSSEISDKEHFVFVGRTRWCQRDPLDPRLYNIGFQIVQMDPEDLDIFIRIFEKYASPAKVKQSADYLWR